MKLHFTEQAPDGWVAPQLKWLGGYPTKKTLEIIRGWPYDKAEELFLELQKDWFGGEGYCYKDELAPTCWHISSAGWSGNEDILAEMRKNYMLWVQIYVAHKVGGHYLFNSAFPSKCFNVRMEIDKEA